MWRFSVHFNNRPDSICSLQATTIVMAGIQNPCYFLTVNCYREHSWRSVYNCCLKLCKTRCIKAPITLSISLVLEESGRVVGSSILRVWLQTPPQKRFCWKVNSGERAGQGTSHNRRIKCPGIISLKKTSLWLACGPPNHAIHGLCLNLRSFIARMFAAWRSCTQNPN